MKMRDLVVRVLLTSLVLALIVMVALSSVAGVRSGSPAQAYNDAAETAHQSLFSAWENREHGTDSDKFVRDMLDAEKALDRLRQLQEVQGQKESAKELVLARNEL